MLGSKEFAGFAGILQNRLKITQNGLDKITQIRGTLKLGGRNQSKLKSRGLEYTMTGEVRKQSAMSGDEHTSKPKRVAYS